MRSSRASSFFAWVSTSGRHLRRRRCASRARRSPRCGRRLRRAPSGWSSAARAAGYSRWRPSIVSLVCSPIWRDEPQHLDAVAHQLGDALHARARHRRSRAPPASPPGSRSMTPATRSASAPPAVDALGWRCRELRRRLRQQLQRLVAPGASNAGAAPRARASAPRSRRCCSTRATRNGIARQELARRGSDAGPGRRDDARRRAPSDSAARWPRCRRG